MALEFSPLSGYVPDMRKVSLQEAQTHLSDLVDDALAGEEVVIAFEGTPLVRLSPVAQAPRRRFGLDQGKIRISEDFDAPLPEIEGPFYGGPDDPS
jgi:prevent-host-death family protein